MRFTRCPEMILWCTLTDHIIKLVHVFKIIYFLKLNRTKSVLSWGKTELLLTVLQAAHCRDWICSGEQRPIKRSTKDKMARSFLEIQQMPAPILPFKDTSDLNSSYNHGSHHRWHSDGKPSNWVSNFKMQFTARIIKSIRCYTNIRF